nr:hypothetical protein [Tanacetum cinerariifolium]
MKDSASWVCEQVHMGRSGEGCGTIQVGEGVRGLVWGRKTLAELVLEAIFDKLTLLIPPLLILTFDLNLTLINGDGREVFVMPIPDALLIDAIIRASYYGRYLDHVSEYQRYLNGEHCMADEEAVPKSPKATKVTKPKAAMQTKPSAPLTTDHVVDEDVDEQPVQDLALNVDNVFQADDFDAFDSDVHDTILHRLCSWQINHSHILFMMKPTRLMIQTFYLSNMISYDQYLKDNAMPVVQSSVSSIPNNAYMMILNDMHEQPP